jgi:hypothetical protein
MSTIDGTGLRCLFATTRFPFFRLTAMPFHFRLRNARPDQSQVTA